MGRPTKLTPEVQKQICDSVALGNSQEAAAGEAGIHEDTLYHWLKLAKTRRAPYAGFSEELHKARSENEANLLKVIHRHTITDWRAAQWLLTVKRPDRYGDVVKHELRFAAMKDNELDAYIAEAERALSAAGAGGASPAAAPAAADEPGD